MSSEIGIFEPPWYMRYPTHGPVWLYVQVGIVGASNRSSSAPVTLAAVWE
jgi:hypothetical protein